MLKLSIALVLILVALIMGGYYWGQSSWKSSMQALQARLVADQETAPVDVFSSQELDGLPAPVRRYFEAVLSEGQPLIRSAEVKHTGLFNMGATEENWQPFTSEQQVVTRPRGFIWDARIRMAPGFTVSVVDAYVAGHGLLEAKLLGLITVMKQPPSSELDQGELLRFFAETPWYPTALLPSQGVTWHAIDDHSARATLTDQGITVSLTLSFNEAGLIDEVYSEARYRDVDGEQVATPWQGRFWEYERRDGLLVPLSGEVAWLLPEGPKPYWRGRMTDIHYLY
ncbi:MAG: hypothetical protein LAT65_01945 [Saccharospirillum sp.]|nr:hypothetical protein [Saccharospirillum sp.]